MGPERRVTLNGLALRPSGSGVQTYIRHMLAHLPGSAPDIQFRVVVQAAVSGLVPDAIEVDQRVDSQRLRRAAEGLRPVGGSDLVHGLDVDLPLRLRCPSVSTVHDLTVFDYAWTTDRLRAVGERRLISRAIRRADQLIAVSHFTAERIAARFGRQAIVIHEAPEEGLGPPTPQEVERVRRRYSLPERFVLYLGNIEPRKNIGVLAAACQNASVPLVVAGGRWGSGLAPAGTQQLGYVPGPDLAALYGASTVFAFPSRYEGFGLPPLEAMACGAVVLASRIPTHQEVLGDSAALAGVEDLEGWTSELVSLLNDDDRRAALARAGQEHATSYSWGDAAAATVGVYRQLGV